MQQHQAGVGIDGGQGIQVQRVVWALERPTVKLEISKNTAR